MRDLYSRLNISPTASPEKIKASIAECSNASVKADAEEVLLHAGRRQTYNRLNTLLTDIGNLRASLGLSHADNWQGEEANEYASSSEAKCSKLEEFAEKIQQPNRRMKITGFAGPIKKFTQFVFGLFRFAIIIFPILIIGLAIYDSRHDIPQFSTSTQSKVPEQRAGVPLPPALVLPDSGTTRKNVTAPSVAPFEIRTNIGSNYLIKLENISGMKVMDIFVRGGDTIEVSVPLGRYIVKYAAGDTWYGYEHYFGPNTNYNKANSIFHFRRDGNQIRGYTYIVHRVPGGNLSTSRIKASQF